jgi:hypothetical protein
LKDTDNIKGTVAAAYIIDYLQSVRVLQCGRGRHVRFLKDDSMLPSSLSKAKDGKQQRRQQPSPGISNENVKTVLVRRVEVEEAQRKFEKPPDS